MTGFHNNILTLATYKNTNIKVELPFLVNHRRPI